MKQFLTVLTNRVEFGIILEGLRDFGGGLEPPKPPHGTPPSLGAIIFCRLYKLTLSYEAQVTVQLGASLSH